jgi:predicted AlkP superfamily pyrophosphatase or phosphodiesterase
MRACAHTGVTAAVLCFVALVLAGCPEPPPPPPAENVVILGLDAGTWEVLDPLMQRGLLPNLQKLRAAGTTAPLQSTHPSSSPVIWTSIATGKTPEKHGITTFVRFPDGQPGKPSPVSRTLRRGKAFWNILGEHGLDVAIVGWFVTWPVESMNGRMVSDRAHWGAIDDQGIFPPSYLSDLAVPTMADARAAMPKFMTYDFDPAELLADSTDPAVRLNYLVFDRFVRAYMRDLYYVRAAERILQDGALPKVLALYLRGTDDVQHGFWKFMEPQWFADVPPDQVERFGKVIERYWQWTDEQVGRILAYYEGKNPLVLVVSDHGAGPAVGQYKIDVPEYLHLSGAHRDKGVLIAAGPGVREGKSVDEASIYDITPTLLWYFGRPVAADMDGKVLTNLFTPAFARRPVVTVPTYDDPEQKPVEQTESKVDEQALEHLRSLGYID